MKRIDKIYEALKIINCGCGASAAEIAEDLSFSRANVCNDLNILVKDGRALKQGDRRPVVYKPIVSRVDCEKVLYKDSILDSFVHYNKSLSSATEQAKSAVLYPPSGMNMLILGETGTGKSMFASLLYKYAVEMKVLDEESPFVVFNCADYANNSSLLLAQLFGVKKGAYTGADADRTGLIEEADTGILFLDEVHRLPPEGQEIFFTFMDRGLYRRLGETNKERTAKVLIIAATTENIESSLLKTFIRRIPAIITIPNLKNRSIDERFNLIKLFMVEECKRLNRQIKMSVNSMRAFLSYDCPNNVGQLKTDIQLTCAKAYADFVSGLNDEIIISSLDIRPYIKEGFYKEVEHRQIWNRLIDVNKRFCVFNTDNEHMILEDDMVETSIYDLIDMRIGEISAGGESIPDVNEILSRDIEEYFKMYLYEAQRKYISNMKSIENLASIEAIRSATQIIKYAEERLGRFLSQKINYALALHIDNSIKRIKSSRKIIHPSLNHVRSKYPLEFEIALDCLKILERAFDIRMPVDEAGFLAMIFVFEDSEIVEKGKMIETVKLIVIAHGSSTATSMTEVVNSLLNTDYVVGINARLDESPQEILIKLKQYLMEINISSDLLLLVDMGSLTNFGREIQKEFDIYVKTVPLVSTLHVLEAARKAMFGESLANIYRNTIAINSIIEASLEEDEVKDKFKIVTICLTGEGTAKMLLNLLNKRLKMDKSLFEIVPMRFNSEGTILSKLYSMKNIVCIVSSVDIKVDLPIFSIEEVIENTCFEKIQEIIDIELTYIKLEDTLDNQLYNIDSRVAVGNIKKAVTNIEIRLRHKLKTSELIGVVFHTSCMLDRLKGNTINVKFPDKDAYIEENQLLYSVVKKEIEFLNKCYSVSVPDDEICYIMNFFNRNKKSYL